MQQKSIRFYDSLGQDGMFYMKNLMRYLQDEHQNKKGFPLPTSNEWRLENIVSPLQTNAVDCGVFVCMFITFLALDCPLTFGQQDMALCRNLIALAIWKEIVRYKHRV